MSILIVTKKKIYLFGTRYDAKRMYDTLRWDKILPSTFFSDWNVDETQIAEENVEFFFIVDL